MLSLYIHIPWCLRKCPYCDFNSHQAGEALPEAEYVEALLLDLEQDLPRVWGRTLGSIFIGGGTPSLLSAEAVDRLLSGIRARLPLKPDLEITLEANPGTAEQDRFADYRAAGVNRLSIGVQSFDDARLEALGRIHDAAEARAAAEKAKAAGFDNFNLDLMFGLPGQDTQGALADLETAIALGPAHISWYQLTLEPHTWFHRHPPALPGDDALWEMQTAGQALLADKGFGQYEVSAYAQTDRRCRHNLNYWRFGDYLGIGAGAHGKITDRATGRVVRLAKHRHPERYLAARREGAFVSSETRLGPADAAFEYLMNALRLKEGFASTDFEAATGQPFAGIRPALETAAARGLLVLENGRVRASEQGFHFLDSLLTGLMPA